MKHLVVSTKYLIMLMALISCGINSCDVIEEPYTKTGGGGSLVLDTNRPNILLEEFTGHTCINCPTGSKIAKTIQQQYPGRVFIVAIHAGSLAAPDLTDDRYLYDFRTNEGTEMYNSYSSPGLPSGLINRTSFQGNKVLSFPYWNDAVLDFLTKNTSRQLDIEVSAQYNLSSNEIAASVKLNYLVSQSTQNKLSVWLLEDNFIGYQKSLDDPFHIPDYQHNDVLRYSFNGAWGEIVNSSAIPAGFDFSQNYSLIIPSGKDWNVNNLRIIAFVYDDENGVKQVMDARVEVE